MRHDKTNKMSVRPAKTQISLGIHPVLSESMLPDLSLRWAHTHFVGFVMSRLICMRVIPSMRIYVKHVSEKMLQGESLRKLLCVDSAISIKTLYNCFRTYFYL